VVLDQAVYGTAEAAALLGLRPARVTAWLDGYQRLNVDYPPVAREVRTGSDLVTWGEFVELGYLREYRKAGVSLQYLRPVIHALRERYHTPYPLAHHRPFIDGRELVLEIQEEHNVPSQLAMVVLTGQGVMLAPSAERFYKKVELAPSSPTGDSHAVHLRPAGPTSPVVIDPNVRFGRPTVDGVSTERLWELVDAGEPIDHIAMTYEMSADRIREAVSYEEQQRTIAA
jgi:uncharacterized protein (DUF433 family)